VKQFSEKIMPKLKRDDASFGQHALGQEKDRPESPIGRSCVQTAGAADRLALMGAAVPIVEVVRGLAGISQGRVAAPPARWREPRAPWRHAVEQRADRHHRDGPANLRVINRAEVVPGHPTSSSGYQFQAEVAHVQGPP
jgi:hypothetical protein